MNKAKITFKIDLDNQVQVDLAKKFMSDLKGTGGEEATVEAKVKDISKKTTEINQAASAASAASVATQKADTSGITLDMISKMTAVKVPDNREAMLAKLKEMGVARAGELDPSAYKEYYDFLEAL